MTHTPDPNATYTANLGIEKATKGAHVGTWADYLGDTFDLIDAALLVGGHEAAVYLDGTTVIARRRGGAVVDSGTAGTDDGDVIQAALDGIARGSVVLAPGEYTLLEPIDVPTGTVLCSNQPPGYSSEPTYYTAMLSAGASFSGGTETGGMVQLGNRSGIAGIRVKGIGGASGVNGISAANVRSVLVRGCRVTNCYRGLQGTGMLGAQILDSEFRWCGHAGISGASGLTDSIISRSFFAANYDADILLGSGGIKIQIADCTFEWGEVEGVRLDSCTMISINGCMFDRKGKEAIYLDSCDHVAITGNCFRRNAAISRNAHIYAVASQFSVTGNEYAAADTIDGAEVGATKPDYVYEIGSGCTVKYYEDPAAQAVGVTVPGA